MMTGSYCGFLLKAGHVWRTSRDFFLQVHNWNSTRGKPRGDRMDLWAFMYQKGIAKVSLWVSLWDWRECGKKGTIPSIACKHEWTNCISRYCKVSLLVVHHIAFHGLEPLSRQKSASQEDSYNNNLAGFSTVEESHSISFNSWVLLWSCWLVMAIKLQRRGLGGFLYNAKMEIYFTVCSVVRLYCNTYHAPI